MFKRWANICSRISLVCKFGTIVRDNIRSWKSFKSVVPTSLTNETPYWGECLTRTKHQNKLRRGERFINYTFYLRKLVARCYSISTCRKDLEVVKAIGLDLVGMFAYRHDG